MLWPRLVLVSTHGHVQSSASSLFARATQEEEWQAAAREKVAHLPVITLLVANLFLFIPAILYIGYTLGFVFPTLAAVESSQDAYYEPIPLHDDDDQVQGKRAGGEKSSPAAVPPQAEEAGAIKRRPVTAGIRTTHQRLCSASSGGCRWRSVFGGLSLAFTINVLSGLVAVPLILALPAGVPSIVLLFLVDVALVQLNTVWVHAVIAPSAAKPWWSRLPPFLATLRATALPTGAVLLATAATVELPPLALRALGRQVADREVLPGLVHKHSVVMQSGWDVVIYFAVWFGLAIFAAYPATVVLTRVQASLLPDEDETIVAFDRSLGRTTPHPSAWQRMVDAYTSYSGSWGRFYKMVVKTYLVSMAISALLGFIVGLQFVVVSFLAN